jgi:hypothetical protein
VFERGWHEFEHFRHIPLLAPDNPSLNRPLWDGRATAGTLLIHAEQGRGDAIQLARYMPWAAAHASRLSVACDPLLHALFSRPPLNCRCHPPDQLPEHDFWLPMFSLPRLFHKHSKSRPDAFPYLSAAPGCVGGWRTRLGNGYKVGLVWAGEKHHMHDHLRSMSLHLLLPLFQIGGVRFFSLQVGTRTRDIEVLGVRDLLVDLSPHIQDYHDTAAAISALDLVISVDTSTAHLAGALAVPVWMMLFNESEWRWGAEGRENAWYPTMRIFRQPRPKDWTPVVQAVGEALRFTVNLRQPGEPG